MRQFGCYATVLLVVISEAATGAVMLWQGWPFTLWPFAVVPAVLWCGFLAIPLFIKFRSASFNILDAIIQTAEAYMARAGYVIDLNRDGTIGHHTPEVKPVIEDHRPIIMRGRVSEPVHKALPASTMADAALDRVGGAGGLAGLETPERPDVKVKVWHLPNKEKCEQGTLELFVDGVFTYGWARDTWLNKGMRREVYEGAIMLLEEAEILVDRKKGFAGRLSVKNSRQARAVLDLPDKSQ